MFNRSKEPTPKAAETGQDAPSPNGRLSLRQAFLLLLATSRPYLLLLSAAVVTTGLAGWKSLTEEPTAPSPPPITSSGPAPRSVEPAATPVRTAPVSAARAVETVVPVQPAPAVPATNAPPLGLGSPSPAPIPAPTPVPAVVPAAPSQVPAQVAAPVVAPRRQSGGAVLDADVPSIR